MENGKENIWKKNKQISKQNNHNNNKKKKKKRSELNKVSNAHVLWGATFLYHYTNEGDNIRGKKSV